MDTITIVFKAHFKSIPLKDIDVCHHYLCDKDTTLSFNESIKTYIPNIESYVCPSCETRCPKCIAFGLKKMGQDWSTFLHNTEGPAIQYNNGVAYMINGVKYKKAEWEKLVGKSNE